ncbi:MAG: tetratricopeptide repeat protein [Minwuia sp.]|nr:tetratricopeptide repeat protein [Minwuia sp.]
MTHIRKALNGLACMFALVALLAFHGAQADQRDPLLDSLFADLQAAEGPAALKVQNRIWEVWHDSGSQMVDLLLMDSREAIQMGLFGQAEEQLDAAVELAPEFAEGWNRRATLRFMRKDYVGSIEDIQKVLDLEPRHFGALSGLGLIYDRIDQPEAALHAFEEALLINPHMAEIRQRADAIAKELKDKEI